MVVVKKTLVKWRKKEGEKLCCLQCSITVNLSALVWYHQREGYTELIVGDAEERADVEGVQGYCHK